MRRRRPPSRIVCRADQRGKSRRSFRQCAAGHPPRRRSSCRTDAATTAGFPPSAWKFACASAGPRRASPQWLRAPRPTLDDRRGFAGSARTPIARPAPRGPIASRPLSGSVPRRRTARVHSTPLWRDRMIPSRPSSAGLWQIARSASRSAFLCAVSWRRGPTMLSGRRQHAVLRRVARFARCPPRAAKRRVAVGD